MATDKSEPKVGLILKVGLTSVVLLIVVRVGMVSYFDNIAADIRAQQLTEMQRPEMNSVNAASSALAQGPMPIDKAMQMLANTSPNRQGMQGVEPQDSHDMRAVTDCWSKMPCDGGGALFQAAAEAVDGAAPAAQNADAGPAADGGASADAGGKATKADAGAAPAPQPKPR